MLSDTGYVRKGRQLSLGENGKLSLGKENGKMSLVRKKWEDKGGQKK